MSFDRAWPMGLLTGDKPQAAELNKIDINQSRAVDGLNGGSYTLASVLTFEGAGVTVDSDFTVGPLGTTRFLAATTRFGSGADGSSFNVYVERTTTWTVKGTHVIGMDGTFRVDSGTFNITTSATVTIDAHAASVKWGSGSTVKIRGASSFTVESDSFFFQQGHTTRTGPLTLQGDDATTAWRPSVFTTDADTTFDTTADTLRLPKSITSDARAYTLPTSPAPTSAVRMHFVRNATTMPSVKRVSFYSGANLIARFPSSDAPDSAGGEATRCWVEFEFDPSAGHWYARAWGGATVVLGMDDP